MPRSPRVEYEGAVYHVMCRGDRRKAIFRDDHDRNMFLATLAAACKRAGWVVHAYVLMPNHYHFLLETPRAGLVDGMRWFQTTYTARFNARHHVCGHLFQGRYKAIPLDSAHPSYFGIVGNYIHLNPARAHLVPKDAPLEAYPWSSYPATIERAIRAPWHETIRFLSAVGLSPRAYAASMARRLAALRADPKSVVPEWKEIRRGWYLGGDDFRREMLNRIAAQTAMCRRDSYSGAAIRAGDLRHAANWFNKALDSLGLTQRELQKRKNTDMEKQAIAWLLRKSTLAPTDWICQQLSLGHRANLPRAVRLFDLAQDPKRTRLRQIMRQIQD